MDIDLQNIDYNRCDGKSHQCYLERRTEDGEQQRFQRTFVEGDYLYEMLIKKDGDYVLVKSERHKAQLPLDKKGRFCFTCYSDEAKRFVELLNDFKAIQKKYQRNKAPSAKLKKLDDFRISKTGILIHEECFVPGRFQFDVEEAVVNTLIKTMSGLIELEDKYVERFPTRSTVTREDFGTSQVLQSHVPKLVNTLDPVNWQPSDVFRHVSYKVEDMSLQFYPDDNPGVSGTDPCMEIFKVGLDRCEFVSRIAPSRPKIFCQPDEWSANAHKIHNHLDGHFAYTSTPQKPVSFVKVGLDERIKIYNGPGITFMPERTRDFSSERFQSTLTHELFHNMGYEEDSRDYNYYYYTCQAALHWDTHGEKLSDTVSLKAAARDCTGLFRGYGSAGLAVNIQSVITHLK
ncbi:MAG: hypothetical protein R3E90_07830 [Marinicella sp.]